MAPFCGKGLKNSSNPPSKRRRGRPAFTPAPVAALPGLASAVVLLRSRLSNRSSRSPGSDVFFYCGHPAIFPASFISSMDSLQSFISSLLSSSRSSPPILPHQHFLGSAQPTLNPLLGPSH
ncbi:hypothetical protein XENOCAPTIV_010258 [Xenoophorus captivus]|uniref:Uncharacterized protein n=1 Tax=Xenoophorus captivus TaxID=1517983 RepID=A0ABV0QHI5_9TELE